MGELADARLFVPGWAGAAHAQVGVPTGCESMPERHGIAGQTGRWMPRFAGGCGPDPAASARGSYALSRVTKISPAAVIENSSPRFWAGL